MHMPVLHTRPCVCVLNLCSSRATSAHVGIGIYQIYPPKVPRVKWPNLLRCSSSECVALTQAGTRTGPHFPWAFYSQVIVCKEIGYKTMPLRIDYNFKRTTPAHCSVPMLKCPSDKVGPSH